MVAEMYDALISAGASDEKARAAATAVAGYDQSALKADMAALRTEVATKSDLTILRAEVSSIRTDVSELKQSVAKLAVDNAVMRWVAGFIVAALTSLVIRAFV